MNKVFGGFLTLLAWVWLVISACAFGIGLILPRKALEGVLDTVSDNNLPLMLLALGLIGLAYVMLRMKMQGLRTRKEIVYANSLGEISVSLAAIAEAMERVLDKNDIIKTHEVSIASDASSKKLAIRARVYILEVNKVTMKASDIQQELARRFEEIMPDAETPKIDVKIRNFSDNANKKSAKKALAEDDDLPAKDENSTDETDYFTGLKYPIDAADEGEEDE